jgi:Uma2 family endonuclease
VCQRLWLLFHNATADDVRSMFATTVRLPSGDGPIPDVVVTTAEPMDCPRWLPPERIHTAIEVVSSGSTKTDRHLKPELYARAGIPCYWRVELAAWRAYRGATPVIVVRVCRRGEWHEVTAVAGISAELPLAVGREADGSAIVTTVKLDPADLVVPGKR